MKQTLLQLLTRANFSAQRLVTMKKFMLLFVGPDYPNLGLSPEQMQERLGKWQQWSAQMNAKGLQHDGEALHSSNVRRVMGPNRTVTDQAGSEIKELVGGYYIVSAKDYDAATEIAQGFPDYDLGNGVEIREVIDFSQGYPGI